MKLNPDTSLTEFMHAIQSCRQDVFYTTSEGDRLNLKSAFSQFLFAAVQSERVLMDGGKIECESTEDWNLLRRFVLEG